MIIHNPILTGSFTVNGTDVASITSSAASITAINNYTASQNILNGTYATTGSNTFKNPQTINSNLIVTGSITAQTLVVQTVSSSVIYSSGSNVFGNNIANTQVFTGSMNLTGSLTVTTIGTELQVTSTGVNLGNALTDSHVISGSLRVNPNGLFVSSSGNVGISTLAPNHQLAAYNSTRNATTAINAGNSNTIPAISIQSDVNAWTDASNGFAFVYNTDNGNLDLYRKQGSTTQSQVMTWVRSNGNVGIGTLNPATKFDLSGSIGNFQIASSGAEIFLTRNENNDILATGGSSSKIRLGAQSQVVIGVGANYEARLTVTSAGNVGIGLTPTYALDVSNSSSPSLRVRNGALGGTATLLLETANDFSGTCQTYIKCIGTSSNGRSELAFGTAGGTGDATATERMRITSGGNVGIGTSSPQAELDVVDPSYNQYTLRVQSAAGNNANGWGGIGFSGEGANTKAAILFLSDGGSYSRGSLIFCNNNDFNQNSATPSNERMRITSEGNVNFQGNGNGFTIGQASGVNRIDHNGSTFRFLGTSNSFTPIAASAFNVNSDYRLKEDLKEFNNSLSIVDSIKIYDFKWKDRDERNYGVIAHELQEVLPYIVYGEKDALEKNGDIQTQGVDYSKIVPILVKAIQELNTKFEEYKSTHP